MLFNLNLDSKYIFIFISHLMFGSDAVGAEGSWNSSSCHHVPLQLTPTPTQFPAPIVLNLPGTGKPFVFNTFFLCSPLPPS